MAQILPDTPLVTTAPEIARVHRLLKQLPDDDYTVWHRLHIHPDPGPDFWILRRDQRAVWLKVSTLNSTGAQLFNTPGLFETQVGRPAESEHRALAQFGQKHFGTAEGLFQRLPALVCFPDLTQPELQALEPLAERPPGVNWIGKETLTVARFAASLEQYLSHPLPADGVAHLRQAFTPEVVIPASFTVRPAPARNTAAQPLPHLLDYEQERVLKLDLALSTDAHAAVGDFNLRLINGVAGSGKSLILVYRAQLLRRLYPDKLILGLTHNQPLVHDLQARYAALEPGDERVKWKTFFQWCRSLWPQGQEWRDVITLTGREHLITRIWHQCLSDTALSERMLADELDWCKDRLIFSLADYLTADRTGRGFALTEAQRQKMYAAFEAYQAELNRRQQMDWGDVPRQLWRWLQAGELRLPQYDVILVDEAQFFAPLWFEIIKRCLKPRVGHLFLVADPSQGFLKRRQSWLASGLEVRGHVHRLQKSYRATREIMDFAVWLYRRRLPEDDDDITQPDLLDMPSGVVPDIIPLTSAQDETTRVVNQIEDMLRQGVPRRHLLVIHADWRGVDRLLERLQAKLGDGAAADAKEQAPGDAIRVCTLNAATGIESPIVFLVGTHALFEQEQSVRLSDEERAELVRDNTRKLYMAITRTGQRLIITYVGELPEAFKRLPAWSNPPA